MNSETATLIAHCETLPFGARMLPRLEWQGSHYLPVEIHRRALWEFGIETRSFPKQLFLDGIPLRLLPDSQFLRLEGQTALYVRTDGVGWLNWLYRTTRRHCVHAVRSVYVRTILTLYVWGFADNDPAKRPSWRDIKFRKR